MDLIQVGPVIDGKQLTEAGGNTFDVINPATGEVIAKETCCDEAAVGRIVESSDRAFHSDAWQQTSPAERGLLLEKLAQAVEAFALSVAQAANELAQKMNDLTQ